MVPANTLEGGESPARRIPSVEGARGIAALSVLTFHVLQAQEASWLAPITSRLWTGVPLFFAISGFVLFRPFARAIVSGQDWPSLRRYAVARTLRIFPALWAVTAVWLLVFSEHMRAGVLTMAAVCAFSVVVWMPPTKTITKALVVIGVPGLAISAAFYATFFADRPSTFQAIRQFLLLQLYTFEKPIVVIGPVWTLCIELGFYLLLPVISWAMLHVTRTSSLAPSTVVGGSLIALAVFGLVYNWFMGWGYGLPTTVPGFVPQFSAGMWLALASECRWFSRQGWPLGAIAIAVVAVAIALQTAGPANNTEGSGPLFGALMAAAFALGLGSVILPHRPNFLSQLLSLRPIVWLGTISYGMYLWHYPVILWAQDHISAVPGATNYVLVLGATLALASGSWHFIEQPVIGASRCSRAGTRGFLLAPQPVNRADAGRAPGYVAP